MGHQALRCQWKFKYKTDKHNNLQKCNANRYISAECQPKKKWTADDLTTLPSVGSYEDFVEMTGIDNQKKPLLDSIKKKKFSVTEPDLRIVKPLGMVPDTYGGVTVESSLDLKISYLVVQKKIRC